MSLNDFDFKKNAIYLIHIPKTSGTSCWGSSPSIKNLGHGFNIPNIYRTPASQKGLKAWKTDKFPLYEYLSPNKHVLTIIRNPFDMLCSYYFHRDSLSVEGYCESGWATVNYTHNFKSFKQFIVAYCDPNFKWHIPALKNFLYSQLFDINGNCVADIIIKYEYRDEAINMLNKKLIHKIDANTNYNKSLRKKNNYKYYYDEEMIKLVEKKCSRELKCFNYDFFGSTKYEPLILNSNVKYDVLSDNIISN